MSCAGQRAITILAKTFFTGMGTNLHLIEFFLEKVRKETFEKYDLLVSLHASMPGETEGRGCISFELRKKKKTSITLVKGRRQ